MDKLDCGRFVLNLSKSLLEYDGREIELTKNELRILNTLARQAGNIVSREELMNDLWSSDMFVDENTFECECKPAAPEDGRRRPCGCDRNEKGTGVFAEMKLIDYLKDKNTVSVIRSADSCIGGAFCFTCLPLIDDYCVFRTVIAACLIIPLLVDYHRRKRFYNGFCYCWMNLNRKT